MNRYIYYEQMKILARAMRAKYGLTTPRVRVSHLNAIYRDQGIRIDLWPKRLREIRGAYFNDELGTSVMLKEGLPEAPMVFTMCHELKHHLVDQRLTVAYCSVQNMKQHIEIGAEVFAAEMIFPEEDFIIALAATGITKGNCLPETLVQLKHETQTTMSYAAIVKRAYRLKWAKDGKLDRIKWKKLEAEILNNKEQV